MFKSNFIDKNNTVKRETSLKMVGQIHWYNGEYFASMTWLIKKQIKKWMNNILTNDQNLGHKVTYHKSKYKQDIQCKVPS
jgi:hypothetical protein